MFDILIQQGLIIDGTGNPGFISDIGILGDKIAAIGRLPESTAKRVIRAHNLIVAPGFIDAHSHSDLAALHDRAVREMVLQGITTGIVGQDGFGSAPVNRATAAVMRRHWKVANGNPPIEWDWSTVDDYLEKVDALAGVNLAFLAPHATIRMNVMGMEDRQPTTSEMDAMRSYVEQAMEHGAVGLSTGLQYSPGSFAATDEIIQLAEVAGRYGGVYVTHFRDYWEHIKEAMAETFEIGRAANIPVHLSHFAATGPNRGKASELLKAVEDARASGIEVTFDSYPYDGGSGPITGLFPKWMHDGGSEALLERLKLPEMRQRLESEFLISSEDWENVMLASIESPQEPALRGRYVAEVAREKGMKISDFVCDVTLEANLQVVIVNRMGSESDVQFLTSDPGQMVCTDGLMYQKHPHPRTYGAFTRFLSRYVRDQELFGLENAIQKTSSLAAQRFGLWDRGLLRPTMAADIVVFDLDRMTDPATYEDPCHHPQGIVYTVVNGETVVEQGEHTGALPGKALRRNGFPEPRNTRASEAYSSGQTRK